jgi:predicted amidophosphoribosyltransferase
MPVANCSKCNKLFQRTTVPFCPACQQESQSHISAVYRFIYDHPNLTTEEIAKQCDVPLKELEAMLFSGKLGTAAERVISHCQSCNRSIPALKQKGRFCPACALKLEVKEREVPAADKQATKPLRDLSDSKAKPADERLTSDNAPSVSISDGSAAKQESASPLSDSYGFKRSSER